MKDDNLIQNLCLHTHNIFCDGKQDINILITNAIVQGVTQIGISSHAPIKIENKWSMAYKELDNYILEIEKCKVLFSNQIEIFTSLEIDYIPNKSYSFDFFRKKLKLDYTIGSIHLVAHSENNELWFIDGNKEVCIKNMNRIFNNDVKLAVSQYFAQTRTMIRSQQPDIIGHMDKVILNTSDLVDVEAEWYRNEITKTLETIKEAGTIVEANTRGIYKGKWKEPFPSIYILKQCYEMSIPVTISSDAHHSSELLYAYNETRQILKKIGYKFVQGRINDKWGNFPI